MSPPGKLNAVTAADDPALVERAADRIADHWPEFMLHDPVADLFYDCYQKLPEYQFVVTSDDIDQPLAIGNSIPLNWSESLADLPDEGWDWAMTKGIEDFEAGRSANYLCALQIVVFKEFARQGISSFAVRAMKENGLARGLGGMMAPVRPPLKSLYPLQSIDSFIRWTDKEGLPFDPWMKTHARLGARLLKPCPIAMRIEGTIDDWQHWTGLHFHESGPHIIPGALVPVTIDFETNTGLYIEPNVWMFHPPCG